MDLLLTTIRRGDAWAPTSGHGDIPERKIVQYWLKIEELSSMTCNEPSYAPSFLLATRVPSAHEGFMLQMVANMRNSTIKP